MGVRLRHMCNCVICFRPCQSNAESAGMPRLETLVTRPDASNRLSHVTWVFRITLRSSVSKHLCFGISTPCRNVSFASAIPSLVLCSSMFLSCSLFCIFVCFSVFLVLIFCFAFFCLIFFKLVVLGKLVIIFSLFC